MAQVELKKYIEKIRKKSHHEERQLFALQGFLNFFNARAALLYNYSTINKIGEGIFLISEEGRFSLKDLISETRKDVRTIPPVYSALIERKAKYIDHNLIQHIPRKYMIKMVPFLVVPIFNPTTVIGYVVIVSSNCNKLNETELNTLTYYGKLLSKVFEDQDNRSNNNSSLNEREIEILQRLSWGESNKEIANYIDLSAFTVQDYIKSAMKKLDVQTRVEAVAVALRKTLIK